MSGAVVATGIAPSDTELVAGVRAGDDHAFEELYRRYQRRISAFVGRVMRDDARAEDVTQEAFMSALRRMRATDAPIIFKPWIYEIARNAAIDSWRRSSRAEEVSINQDELLRPGDRSRLVGSRAPETLLFEKERIDHLRRALDGLSQTHHRILVMRELEGLSYREIGERLELTRPAVESTLFRARRRLEREYQEIEDGSRCEAIEQAILRLAQGGSSETDLRRLSRHARGCTPCRRRAREMGVEPLRSRRAAARAAALLPLPGFVRRRFSVDPTSSSDPGFLTNLVTPGAHFGPAVAERAAALVAAAAIAGAGGAVLGGIGTPDTVWSGGGHHHAAPGSSTPRAAGRAAAHQARGRATGSAPTRHGRSAARSHRAAPSRSAGPRSRRPRTEGHSAPALPPAGQIESPARPKVPAAPRVDVDKPKTPGLPEAPTLRLPSAPIAGPSAKTPQTSTRPVGDLTAAGI